jgi:hypothetical protein
MMCTPPSAGGRSRVVASVRGPLGRLRVAETAAFVLAAGPSLGPVVAAGSDAAIRSAASPGA